MTSSSSSSAAPPWADASSSASKRPAPIEDHRGTIAGGAAVAMTDDDGLLLAPVSTLDEPVSETIMRDVRAVGAKLRAVLLPLDRTVSSVCGGGGHSSRSFGGKIISFPKKSEVGFPPSPPPPHPFSRFTSVVFGSTIPFSTQQRPFGYVDVLQEEDVNPSVGQRDVLNQLRDWDLW